MQKCISQKNSKQQTICSLGTHLKAKHFSDWKTVEELLKQMNGSKEPRSRPKDMQLTLEEMQEKSKKWADDSTVALRIETPVMERRVS